MPRHSAPQSARHSAPQQAARLVRPRLAVTLVVAAAGLATAVWLPTRHDSADASERGRFPAPEEFAGEFTDDFQGGEGSTVDPGLWELADRDRFDMSTRSARLDGAGNLVLTARESRRRGIVTAELTTKETFRRESGRLEARIRVPEGLAPAFEVVTEAGKLNLLRDAKPGDFHTYAVTWTPGSLRADVDGVTVQEVSDVPTDQAFRLSLSLGVPGDDAPLPAEMLVDFVRVSPLDEEQSPAPSESPSESPSASPSESPSASPTPSESPSASPAPSETAAPAWKTFVDYAAGDVVSFEGAEYEVLEAHTSLPGWEPTALPALFKKL
ncbi:carbohydrate-binding protein [Actinoplanes sp. RD1]|uniref:carbohydrate-binding protein n=1 Tax=Actinoplanes sp. RD1 TaxID=3064538 RepID=UPI002740D606|nr:carbohydrate-binding protein [Actinoplanes sp. RD1]